MGYILLSEWTRAISINIINKFICKLDSLCFLWSRNLDIDYFGWDKIVQTIIFFSFICDLHGPICSIFANSTYLKLLSCIAFLPKLSGPCSLRDNPIRHQSWKKKVHPCITCVALYFNIINSYDSHDICFTDSRTIQNNSGFWHEYSRGPPQSGPSLHVVNTHATIIPYKTSVLH